MLAIGQVLSAPCQKSYNFNTYSGPLGNCQSFATSSTSDHPILACGYDSIGALHLYGLPGGLGVTSRTNPSQHHITAGAFVQLDLANSFSGFQLSIASNIGGTSAHIYGSNVAGQLGVVVYSSHSANSVYTLPLALPYRYYSVIAHTAESQVIQLSSNTC